MPLRLNSSTIDISVFIIANFVNLLISFLFWSRARGAERAEYIIGLIVVLFIIPLFAATLSNYLNQRESWTFLLPLPLMLYLIIEFLFDYVFKIDFRNNWLMWPYILVFYAGLMGMIGYSFLVNRTYGFITLVTYFINLFMTIKVHD
jgi:uncharacterized membrane protein